jgi:hypothetical protein
MFVRFRQSRGRLALSLVTTERAKGRVRAEHIASLGSVSLPLTVADRIQFWHRLHERLARLGNRVDPEAQAKLLTSIYERVPMPTIAELHAEQLKNAEDDEQFWLTVCDTQKEMAEGYEQTAAAAGANAVAARAAMTEAAERAAAIHGRIEQLKRGETVAGFTKPLSYEEALRIMGWTASDVRHADRLAEIERMGATGEFIASTGMSRRREQAASRTFLRRKRHFGAAKLS